MDSLASFQRSRTRGSFITIMLYAILPSVWRRFWPLKTCQCCPKTSSCHIRLLIIFSPCQTSCKRKVFRVDYWHSKLYDEDNAGTSGWSLSEALWKPEKMMESVCSFWSGEFRRWSYWYILIINTCFLQSVSWLNW